MKKKSRPSLVPLLEEYLAHTSHERKTERNREFVHALMGKGVTREQERVRKRLLSPSSLGTCLRKVYLDRHHADLGIPRQPVGDLAMNFYLYKGDSFHDEMHLLLFNLAEWIDDPKVFWVYGFEIPVISKHGDHGGTIDCVAKLYRQPRAIDYKGLNAWSAKKARYGKVSHQYRIQLADYMLLWNVQRRKPFEIKDGFILVEEKGWLKGDTASPWCEVPVSLDRYRWELNERVRILRAGKMPPAECTLTTQSQFKNCPFNAYCYNEVRLFQKKRTGKATMAIATPGRVERALRKRGH